VLWPVQSFNNGNQQQLYAGPLVGRPPPPENFLGGTVRVWEDGEGGEDREDLVSLLMKAVSQQGGHCQANVVVLDALWCLSRASTGAACHPQVTCAEPPLEYKRRVQL
jgi:hypothetical protein